MACAGSTELDVPHAAGPGQPVVAFDPDAAYELDPAVALRPEPFGALAYHYGNRRLNFLKSVELVEVVESLGRHASARGALCALGVADDRSEAFEAALSSLLSSGVIRAR